MAMGDHHKVAIIIRISVHHDKGMLSSVDNEPFMVGLGTGWKTEDATPSLPFQDVVHSPGCPEMFHRVLLKAPLFGSVAS